MTGWISLSGLDYRMSLYCIKQRDNLQKMSINTERQVKQSLEKRSKLLFLQILLRILRCCG